VIDVTPQLQAFIGRRSAWPIESSIELASAIATRVRGTVDWDGGAAEGWARILVVDGSVGAVSMQGPLLLLTEAAAAEVTDLSTEFALIEVHELGALVLRCDREVLREAFGDRAACHPALKTDQFSAADLWFVSI